MTANITNVVDPKKEALKKASKAFAKQLAVNIVLGVAATVAVSLISGAILTKVAPVDTEASE